MPQAKLKDYRKKRSFDKTPEPKGLKQKKLKREPIFVVQKHAASHLHFDFRLEVAGVLKSWAIPKGPSTNPATKRLAVATEDHPLEYALFEGTIPKGEYGGGEVIVWDIGTYTNIKEKFGSMDDFLKKGHIEVFLEGKKLKGAYVLIRMRTADHPDKNWLLIKMQDEYVDLKDSILEKKPKPVLSKKTIAKTKK